MLRIILIICCCILNKCDAKLKNGILNIEIEKIQKDEDKTKKIEIIEE